MTADFRALCVELTDCLEKADWPLRHRYVFRQWIDIARAALSDEPAVPQGREPAAVTGQPSDEELLKLAQQYSVVYLLSDGSACHPFQEGYDMRNDVLNFARAVLARWGHQPAPPADGEVAELVAELQSMATDADRRCRFSNAERLTRAAELLQRQTLPEVGE